jgi:hypothetical protein
MKIQLAEGIKMSMVEEIEKALQAHRLWRAQLKEAIQTCKINKPIDVIRADDMCDFGKWLYGQSIPPEYKASLYYKSVIKLHAEFHLVAAEVAKLAIAGKSAEAEELMSTSGKYLDISAKLSSVLSDWKQKLQTEPVQK